MVEGLRAGRRVSVCKSCGVDSEKARKGFLGGFCFDCGLLQRPFERDLICNVCGEEKPIVRLYLTGPACDDCAPSPNPAGAPPANSAD